MTRIERTIARLLRQYGYAANPRAINGGLCVEFAQDLLDTLPKSAEYLEAGPDEGFEYAFKSKLMHAFVRYQGRFYDSESPHGVNTWKELPIFQRNL